MNKAHLPRAFGALTLLLLTQGCSGVPIACPAIGWSNVVEVTLIGDAEPVVTRVQVCVGTDCEVIPSSPPSSTDEGIQVVEPSPVLIPEGILWSVPTSMSTESEGEVVLFDEENRVVLSEEVKLAWQQDGGTTECGGPSTAKVAISV